MVGHTQVGREKGKKRNEKANRVQGWKREERRMGLPPGLTVELARTCTHLARPLLHF